MQYGSRLNCTTEYEPNEVRVLDKHELDKLELDKLELDRLVHDKLVHDKLVLSMQECGMLALNRLELDIKELGMLELGRLEFGMLGHKIEETRNPDPIVVVHYILLLDVAFVGIQRGSGDTDVVDHADRADHIARTQASQPLIHWPGKLREPVLGRF